MLFAQNFPKRFRLLESLGLLISMFGPKHSITINLHYLLLFEFLGKEFFFFFCISIIQRYAFVKFECIRQQCLIKAVAFVFTKEQIGCFYLIKKKGSFDSSSEKRFGLLSLV